jgi:acyl-CoA reductase-like NAD-dependent aldehyde dehydrogenase
MTTPHLPVLRWGRPYRSLDRLSLPHVVSGEPVVEVSLANPGLIARDLAEAGRAQRALSERSAAERIDVCRRAAELFRDGELPLDPEGDAVQGPDDYVRQLSGTTGIPEALVRTNMDKIHFVLSEMERVLGGLTRGLESSVLDNGWGVEDDRPVSYRLRTDALGVVLPSNSPGVHSLWIPSIAFGVPVAAKPGRHEPWTPLRVAQALRAAGAPPEAVGFYPSDHAGSTEILLHSGRSMLFGDRSTVGAWAEDPRVELHGPGWSKVLLGEDQLRHWRRHLDLMVNSVAANGGRSCINASGVWVPKDGPIHGQHTARELARALAERLAEIEALPLDHPEARLAAWGDGAAARRISDWLDARLATPGAVDVSAELRPERVVEVDGVAYLLPTVVWCEDPEHPLARTELLFPFVAVVEVPTEKMLDRIGPTLVASALTEDPRWTAELLGCRSIERLNVGAIPTSRVSWDQPHEGNLFEHLYHRRAFQGVAA